MAKIIKRALSNGRQGQGFTDRDLFGTVPSAVLVDHIALPQIMDGVVTPMARTAGYLDKGGPAEPVIETNLPSWSSAPAADQPPS